MLNKLIYIFFFLVASCVSTKKPPTVPTVIVDIKLPDINIRTYNSVELQQHIEQNSLMIIKEENSLKELEKIHDAILDKVTKNIDLVENKKRLEEIERKKKEVQKRLDTYKGFQDKLKERKTMVDDNYYVGNLSIDKSTFTNFAGLYCGQHIDAAYDKFGPPNTPIQNEAYNRKSISYEKGGKEIIKIIYSSQSEKIESISIQYIDSVEFLKSKGVTDNKINLMAKKRQEIVKIFNNEDPYNIIAHQNQYNFKNGIVYFYCYPDDNFNCSMIKVVWSGCF